LEGNKLLNEQRDRKTNELQVTGTREIIDGKMVEVKKLSSLFL
jgi:hypothetical protein